MTRKFHIFVLWCPCVVWCTWFSCSFAGWFGHDRAIVAAQHKSWHEASQRLNACLIEHPDNPELLYDAGVVAYRAANYKQAQGYFKRCLDVKPSDKALCEHAFFNFGNSCVALNELRKAIEAYEKALEIDAHDEHAQHNLKKARDMLKDQEKRAQEEQQKKDEEKKKNEEQKKENEQQQQKQDQKQNQKKDENKDQKQRDEHQRNEDTKSDVNKQCECDNPQKGGGDKGQKGNDGNAGSDRTQGDGHKDNDKGKQGKNKGEHDEGDGAGSEKDTTDAGNEGSREGGTKADADKRKAGGDSSRGGSDTKETNKKTDGSEEHQKQSQAGDDRGQEQSPREPNDGRGQSSQRGARDEHGNNDGSTSGETREQNKEKYRSGGEDGGDERYGGSDAQRRPEQGRETQGSQKGSAGGEAGGRDEQKGTSEQALELAGPGDRKNRAGLQPVGQGTGGKKIDARLMAIMEDQEKKDARHTRGLIKGMVSKQLVGQDGQHNW